MYSSHVSNSSISSISSVISVVVDEVVDKVVDAVLLDEVVVVTVEETSVETDVIGSEVEAIKIVSVVEEFVKSSKMSMVGEVLAAMGDVRLDDVRS